MTTIEQAAIAMLGFYVLAAPYLAAWLAVRLCSRNYDCPLRRENAAAKWTKQLEAERGT
jgi:hypothetical protein